MKQHLISLTAYNLWANMQFVKMLQALNTEQCNTTIAGSFDSIRKTVVHIYMAEFIWNERLALAEKLILPSNYLEMEMPEALQIWITQSERLHTFTKKQFDDNVFAHEVVYTDLKNTHHKSSVAQILTHVCNHSTLHRGQLVNFMRAVGVTNIVSTDYIAYCRIK